MLNKIGNTKVKCFTKQHPLSPIGHRIVQIGQRAVHNAISKHKAMGNPIYFKEKGLLIKELADGTRFIVKASLDGITTVRKI